MAETLAIAPGYPSPCLKLSSRSSSFENPSTSQCSLHFSSSWSTLDKHRGSFRTCSCAPSLPRERRKRLFSSRCSSIRATGKHNGSATITEELPSQANDPLAESAFTVVMKFGGSSVASAARMREVADLILSFPDERPIIVLSAMGKTTNNLINAAEIAVTCGALKCCATKEYEAVKNLHLNTADKLGVDRSVITGVLDELGEVLKSIATLEDLSSRTRDRLVSFGERLSTRIFAEYLRKRGVKAKQYDAFEIGFITTDEFTNAEILQETYSAVAETLLSDWSKDPVVPIVTGFLGKGKETRAVTTLGRGGSDLTATAIGKALRLKEVQVWKDVDGVLTCDPSICPTALPVPYLTYEEAGELAYFGAQVLHPQSMKPAREAEIPVRVKNSYNREAPGTLINNSRDLSQSWLTSIVVKRSVTLLDIVSTRMLGQFGFLAEVFSIFAELKISVDVVATSEVSISLTLDPSKIWSRDLIPQELESMVNRLKAIASVNVVQGRSIISLIGNVERSSLILEKVFGVFREQGIKVQMISQGASKVNISLIVNDEEAERLVKALHVVFFERECSIILEDLSVRQLVSG